jgi:peptidoglycan hydrolase-like protein with peptidoglycan-binding domain
MVARQWIVSMIFFGLFSVGCDVIYKFVDKEGAQEKELLGEMIPFESNYTLKEVQILLSLYGYSLGRVDGKMGNRTRDAIGNFQNDAGLKVTRRIDEETWERLKSFRDYTLVVGEQLNFSLIQEILHAAGFYTGKIDGKWGARSKEALKKFQEYHELSNDGRFNYQTLKMMSRYLVFD